MSDDIIWSVIRDNSCHMLKVKNFGKPLSTDPLNLTNKHCKRYSGLANRKAIGIRPIPAQNAGGKAEKGFVLTVKCSRRSNRPRGNCKSTTTKFGANGLNTLRNMISKQKYRKDLKAAALRRASAINRSQKPLPKMKGTRKPKKE